MSTSQPPRATKDASQGLSEAPRRGRVVPSRYMNATASSRAAVTSKAASVQQKPSSSTLGPVRRENVASTRSKFPASATSTVGAKLRTIPTQPSSSSVSRPLGPPSRPALTESASTGFTSAVELDMASQLYPWLFMRHTLTESSHTAAGKSQAILSARAKELDAEEQALADDRVRYQAERETHLFDELSNERMCRVAPPLIQKFIHSHRKCQDAISYAAQVASLPTQLDVSDARVRLTKLEQFAEESSILRADILELVRTTGPDSDIGSTLGGILHLLDARLESLQLSRELLSRTRDNFMMTCHLESLSVGDL